MSNNEELLRQARTQIEQHAESRKTWVERYFNVHQKRNTDLDQMDRASLLARISELEVHILLRESGGRGGFVYDARETADELKDLVRHLEGP